MPISSYGTVKNYSTGGGSGGGGGIWVIDAVVANSSGTFINNKVKVSPSGVSMDIEEVQTDAQDILVTILVDRGGIYEPTLTVNGIMATRAAVNTSQARSTGTLEYTVTLPDVASISMKTDTGLSGTVKVNKESPAVITNLVIVNNPASTDFYPLTQTEVKSGDPLYISFDTDKDIVKVVIITSGAGRGETFNIPATSKVTSLAISCGSTSTVAAEKRVSIKVTTVAGAETVLLYETDNTILCNNLYPSITISNIVYPTGQEALKGDETATVDNTIEDYDSGTEVYSSNGELDIEEVTTFEATKTVTRISGGYNVSANNFTISATRNANGATSTKGAVIFIANTPCVLSITRPALLKSGGNDGTTPVNHTITLQANQRVLNSGFSLTDGEGNFTGVWNFITTGHSRSLVVHDDDAKGDTAFTGASITNLAAIVTNGSSNGLSYTLAGFVQRSLTIAAFGDRANIGVEFVNSANLIDDWTGKAGISYVSHTIVPTVNSYNLSRAGLILLLDESAYNARSQESEFTIEETV